MEVGYMQKLYEQFTLGLGRVLTLSRDDLRREDGQGVTEYGLALAFVAIALAAVLVVLKSKIAGFIDTVGDDLADLPGSF
jgi:Flp pilus assembly pilin Flp